MSTPTITIPGYVVGTWSIDPTHSDVSFAARHMMVSKVRGHFRSFQGTLTTPANPLESTVEVTIELASVDTANQQRDDHIRSGDFLEVETYPTMTYRSTGVRQDDGDFVIDGELTLKGVTKQVPLQVEFNGVGPDGYGGTRAGFTAKAGINRRDFGVNFSAAMETGGVVVSDKIQIEIEAEVVLDQ